MKKSVLGGLLILIFFTSLRKANAQSRCAELFLHNQGEIANSQTPTIRDSWSEMYKKSDLRPHTPSVAKD